MPDLVLQLQFGYLNPTNLRAAITAYQTVGGLVPGFQFCSSGFFFPLCDLKTVMLEEGLRHHCHQGVRYAPLEIPKP